MSKQFAEWLNNTAEAIGTGVKAAANHSAKAAATANAISAGAQSAQGNFNQTSANNANAIGSTRTWDQYGFNSGQAALANNLTEQWFNQSMEFNAEQAALNRAWQERMDSTKYQRAVKDMEKAGLNPILAATGGVSTGGGGGSAASISAPSAQSASGGLMNGISASEGNYTGQMEYMGGMLGLISALTDGISTAVKSWNLMQNMTGEQYSFGKFIQDLIPGGYGSYDRMKEQFNNPNTKYNQFKYNAKNYINSIKNRINNRQ